MSLKNITHAEKFSHISCIEYCFCMSFVLFPFELPFVYKKSSINAYIVPISFRLATRFFYDNFFQEAFRLAAFLVAVSCQLNAHAAEVCRVPTADNFDEEGFFETSSFTTREAEIIALSRDLTSKSREINA